MPVDHVKGLFVLFVALGLGAGCADEARCANAPSTASAASPNARVIGRRGSLKSVPWTFLEVEIVNPNATRELAVDGYRFGNGTHAAEVEADFVVPRGATVRRVVRLGPSAFEGVEPTAIGVTLVSRCARGD